MLDNSAEVIGLSLKTSGMDAYLNVQVFTGSMFTASFISCKFPVLLVSTVVILLTVSPVWLLRSWKLQKLALLGLDRDQKAEQVAGTAGGGQESPQTSGVRGYLRGMIVLKRV